MLEIKKERNLIISTFAPAHVYWKILLCWHLITLRGESEFFSRWELVIADYQHLPNTLLFCKTRKTQTLRYHLRTQILRYHLRKSLQNCFNIPPAPQSGTELWLPSIAAKSLRVPWGWRGNEWNEAEVIFRWRFSKHNHMYTNKEAFGVCCIAKCEDGTLPECFTLVALILHVTHGDEVVCENKTGEDENFGRLEMRVLVKQTRY